MNQEVYSFSDLDFLLSKDKITEDDLQQLPELFLEEPKTPSNQTSITHELENLSITPTDKPTIALTLDPENENQLPLHDNSYINRRKTKKPLPNTLPAKIPSSNLIWPTELKKILISGE